MISVAELQKALVYDPETGSIRWSDSSRRSGPALATKQTMGYFYGTVGGEIHLAHRVAWALHYGRWPEGEIDHINGNGRDNRIANLRDVSHTLNQRNRKRRSDNKSGVDGVNWCKRTKSWRARKGHGDIGRFKTLEQAAAARKAWERAHGYHPNHGR